jgi:hypothetical protein
MAVMVERMMTACRSVRGSVPIGQGRRGDEMPLTTTPAQIRKTPMKSSMTPACDELEECDLEEGDSPGDPSSSSDRALAPQPMQGSW